MSISRRQFLLCIPTVTAGLLLPKVFDSAMADINVSGEEFLNESADPDYHDTIHSWLNDGQYVLSIDDEMARPDPMTHREAVSYLGYESLDEYVSDYLGYDDDDPFDPDSFVDEEIYFLDWFRDNSPEVRACRYLKYINNDLRKDGKEGLDYIEFIYSDEPREYSQTAVAPDLESLLLLQQQLNEMNEGMRVELDGNYRVG